MRRVQAAFDGYHMTTTERLFGTVSMQGSLDSPPVVISTSRAKAALIAVIAALFVAMIIEMWSSGAIAKMTVFKQFWMYAGLALFGLGLPLMLLRLIRPDRLMLSPNGIDWLALRKQSWRWSEVQHFRPYKVSRFSSHVGFNFTDEYKRLNTMRQVSSFLTGGVESSFGGGWELSPREMAALLNDAKQRWD
jgi:hypothetical protein